MSGTSLYDPSMAAGMIWSLLLTAIIACEVPRDSRIEPMHALCAERGE